MATKPEPVPAPVPDPDEDDDFDPTAGAPVPPKAPRMHPVKNRGSEEERRQGTNLSDESGSDQGNGAGVPEPRNQGTEGARGQGRLSSADRPKLGARVDPWLKRALKIAAAIEGRTEEALVHQALTAYLWQHHPQLAAEQQTEHAAR